ncbi:MAG: hypothetical protein ACLQVL_35610 [Terriglobia bacterium]
MPDNNIAKPEDFRRALERANIERVVLPASGLSVLLCRPPVFAALAMGRAGTQLQSRITDAKAEEVKAEDIEAFTRWLSETLARLFVQPRFATAPGNDEIGLADLLIEDLKFVFRWLRGEVFSADRGTGVPPVTHGQDGHATSATEDLGEFPPRQRANPLHRGSGETQPLPGERTSGTHGDAGVPVGLQRG